MSSAGYTYLTTYILGTIIYDLTVVFCQRFVTSIRQTEQMTQAARSDKSNIAEGYTFQSLQLYISLLGTAEVRPKSLLEIMKIF